MNLVLLFVPLAALVFGAALYLALRNGLAKSDHHAEHQIGHKIPGR